MAFNSQYSTSANSISWLFLFYCFGFLAVLYLVDSHTRVLKPLHQGLSFVASPVRALASTPQQLLDGWDNNVKRYEQLLDERDELARANSEMQVSLLELASLRAENVRLRELLRSTQILPKNYQAAEILSIRYVGDQQEVMINQGAQSGVFESQAVLDASGLMGQVVEVFDSQSRVVLINDSRHRTPVMLIRNGVRGIVRGRGESRQLAMDIPKLNADLSVGDLLVSSGLGGVFPQGYPVGTIIEIKPTSSEAFIRAIIQPSANLSTSSHVLLVTEEPEQNALERNASEANTSQNESLAQPEEATP
ncbi:MAG: rod shape-determining protein MreC [Pseudomonadota bacterium]|nr:rod shape-determining protein MreC [Pseudomonadota bacterium]